jgi:arabinogalactan oligomer/maltooligosaccharide transport system substrate-binding protein
MKRKYLSLLLAASMVGCLVAGCGSSSDNSSDDNKAASSEDAIQNLIDATDGTVTLQVWCSELEAYQTTFGDLIEQFEAQYPDVDFDIELGAVSESDAKDRVLEDVEAAADVFVFADDQLSELVKAGALQSVDATYTYDPAETNSTGTVEAASQDGTLYAYPLTASNGYYLYYNSEYLSEEDCSSWEGLIDAAEAQGKKVGMEVSSGWYLYGFFAGAGCELTMNEDQSNNCDWNSETGLAVAQAVQALAARDGFVNVGNDDAVAMLPDGDLIAYVSGTWNVPTFEENYGDGYAACKLPTFTAGGKEYQMGSYAGYKFVGVNKYSSNVGWSMLLAEYLTNETSQAQVAEATGEGPANINAASQIESPALAALAAQSEYADQQVVGGNFWDPAASLGQSLVDGSDDLQTLLDDAVAGITQPVE